MGTGLGGTPGGRPVTNRIFDGAHLRAVLHPGRTGLLMVTFDYRMDDKAGFSADAHSTGFARMGHAQLSIKTRGNDWFINPDTVALEAVLPSVAARFDRVQMLGFSMGAYGALRFAKALGAKSLVAVSPQVSVDPGVVPFERRYVVPGFDPVSGNLTSVADPGLEGLLLVDPFEPADLAHARLVQALFPQLRLVRLNFGGHPAFQIVREGQKSWTLHHAAVAARPDPLLIRAAHRDGRRRSAGYWTRLAAHAQASHPALAAFARLQAGSRGFGVDGPAESP
jgi:hypothetical protein